MLFSHAPATPGNAAACALAGAAGGSAEKKRPESSKKRPLDKFMLPPADPGEPLPVNPKP